MLSLSVRNILKIAMTTDLSFITNEKKQSLKDRFEVLIKDTSVETKRMVEKSGVGIWDGVSIIP